MKHLDDHRVVVRTLVVGGLSLAAVVAGCGGGGASRKVSPSPRRTCVQAAGYGGLGGPAASFAANNNGIVGRGGPTPGAAWYEVLATRRGCVVAYSVEDSATPPLRAAQMLDRVGRTYLPADAERVAREGRCIVWRSALLRGAVGALYAKALAAAQTAAFPGVALVEASPGSRCP